MTDDEKDVKLALSIEEGLTDWEIDFVEGLESHVSSEGLSEKQRNVLYEILDKHGK